MEAIEDEAIKKMPAEDSGLPRRMTGRKCVLKVPQFLDDDREKEYHRLKKRAHCPGERSPTRRRSWRCRSTTAMPRPPQTTVLIRGNPHAAGATVEPAFPKCSASPLPTIAGAPGRQPSQAAGGRCWRTGLRRADNPLTARVMVNRIWQGHFGRGIVASPNDFGKFGDGCRRTRSCWTGSPTEFVDGGWKLKSLHRLILTSRTYQMSGAGDADAMPPRPGQHALRPVLDAPA